MIKVVFFINFWYYGGDICNVLPPAVCTQDVLMYKDISKAVRMKNLHLSILCTSLLY